MPCLIAAGSLFLLITVTSATISLNPLSDEFISLINSKQNSWRAGRNFAVDTPMSYINKLMGLKESDHRQLRQVLPTKVHDANIIADLPDSFDSRTKWPNCPSLNEIRDQGSCGSCWAFGAVEAITDRVCIYSNGTKNFHFSAQDLVSCSQTDGCGGGRSVDAWNYWKDVGIVSGGAYNSSEGCMPYELPPCEHHTEGKLKPCVDYSPTPKCENKCRPGYNVDYNKDKQRGKSVHTLYGEDQIRADLFFHGPVEASFTVYEDFVNYKTGVYSFTHGQRVGGHAVKILGWGEEDGTKFWLVANSWNSDWGDKGFFKIRRGHDECHIEDGVVAGVPLLEDL